MSFHPRAGMSDGFSALRPRPSLVGVFSFCVLCRSGRLPRTSPLATFFLGAAVHNRGIAAGNFVHVLRPFSQATRESRARSQPGSHAADNEGNHRRFAVVPLALDPQLAEFACYINVLFAARTQLTR